MYKIDKIKKENRRVNFVKKSINILIYIILIPIIIINFTMIIESFINSGETPNIFGYKSFTIVSGSMEPTINIGDLIIVKEVEQSQISKDDIISFRDSESITTHRITNITDDNGIKKYTTKGDNNNSEDKEKVIYEKVEGKYILKIKGVGNIIDILKKPTTLIIVVVLLIVNYLYRKELEEKKLIRKEVRKRYKEREEEKE